MKRFFRKPDLVLSDPQNGGVVFTPTPNFRWGWTSPLQAEASVEYNLTVFRTQNDEVTTFADVIIPGPSDSWMYSGEALPADGEFIDWQLEATVSLPSGDEFTQVRAGRFIYDAGIIIVPELSLTGPQDGDTLTSTPVLSWSMSQLPNDYNLEFVLTITADTVDAAAEVFDLDRNQRTFVFNTEALNDNVTYRWDVLAKYGPPESPLEEILSETRRFTYQSRGVIGDGFQLRLLASMHGNIPPEMLDMIIQALSSEDVTINSIIVDGVEFNFEQLLDVFRDEKNEVVLINISD